MHIWGYIVLHPTTVPVADQFNAGVVMMIKYTTLVYCAVLKPTVEDFRFLFEHIH